MGGKLAAHEFIAYGTGGKRQIAKSVQRPQNVFSKQAFSNY